MTQGIEHQCFFEASEATGIDTSKREKGSNLPKKGFRVKLIPKKARKGARKWTHPSISVQMFRV
ncbi:MAG: hypothetical protein AAF702_39650, partial [Chloroflexota bacterium]